MLSHVWTKLALVALIISPFVLSVRTTAQSNQSNPQIYGEPDGLTGEDCEGIMMRLDFVAIDDRDTAAKDQPIIIIARLGSGESARNLNRRRLYQAAEYLNQRVSKDKIIIAEGERVRGLGQLEFYVGGKLNIVFKVKRNRDLVKGCAEVHDAG